MKTHHYFVYYKITYNNNKSKDQNCIVILDSKILKESDITSIQNNIKHNTKNCKEILVKNFQHLYTYNNNHYPEYK